MDRPRCRWEGREIEATRPTPAVRRRVNVYDGGNGMKGTRVRSDAAPAGATTLRAWALAGLAACGLWAGPARGQDRPEGPVTAYAQFILDGKTQPKPELTQAGCCG